MSEGELYKKLIEIGRKAHIPCAGQEKAVIVPYLQVLDEAKQDYPTTDTVLKKHPELNPITDANEINAYLVAEKDIWFLTQLGEVKTE